MTTLPSFVELVATLGLDSAKGSSQDASSLSYGQVQPVFADTDFNFAYSTPRKRVFCVIYLFILVRKVLQVRLELSAPISIPSNAKKSPEQQVVHQHIWVFYRLSREYSYLELCSSKNAHDLTDIPHIFPIALKPTLVSNDSSETAYVPSTVCKLRFVPINTRIRGRGFHGGTGDFDQTITFRRCNPLISISDRYSYLDIPPVIKCECECGKVSQTPRRASCMTLFLLL
ncbi:hypothetical protein PM082_005249 [Marasmius tenuissimus]|nr:hypothetical protein PM082_005249 [Marasmius tenuissimus]